MKNDNTEILLFDSRPGEKKVRFLAWTMFAVMAGCILAARFVYTAENMTVSQAASDLMTQNQRLAMAAGIAFLGAAFFAGMLLYMRFYVITLKFIANQSALILVTPGLFRNHTRKVLCERIKEGKYFRGKRDSNYKISVDAPYYWIGVRGSSSFLLDAQGRFYNTKIANRLLGLDVMNQKYYDSLNK